MGWESGRGALRDALAARPALSQRLGRICAVMGARRASATLIQLSNELVTVSLPESNTFIKMFTRVESDQIAVALRNGWHAFEWPMPSVFAAYVGRFPGVVLDVGANTGFYSIVAAAADTRNRVIAFEPFPPVLALLRSTVRLNRCEHRVAIAPIAVSNEVGHADLFVPLQDHGLVETSSTLNGEFKAEHSERVRVEMTTIDAYVDRLTLTNVTMIKIDVESFEAQVLSGAQQLMNRDRPVIFCEVLPQGDAARIDEIRAQHDYVDVRLHNTEAVIARTVEFDAAGWNHLLVPREQIETIRTLLGGIGLRVNS